MSGKTFAKNRGLIASLKVKYIIPPGDGDYYSDDKKKDYKAQLKVKK
ncbi:TPA: hypothetical protein ACG0AP_003563 [Elizabethkingia anophelis]